ncbi:sf3b1, partial [Symbiodinium sp. KB8]
DFWTASLESLPTPKLECHVSVTLSFLGKIGQDEVRSGVIGSEEFTDVFKEDQVESIVEAIHSVKRRVTLATLPDEADLQLKSCNQCRWAKHGSNWKSKCVYQTSDGDWVTYLEVAPAGR